LQTFTNPVIYSSSKTPVEFVYFFVPVAQRVEHGSQIVCGR